MSAAARLKIFRGLTDVRHRSHGLGVVGTFVEHRLVCLERGVRILEPLRVKGADFFAEPHPVGQGFGQRHFGAQVLEQVRPHLLAAEQSIERHEDAPLGGLDRGRFPQAVDGLAGLRQVIFEPVGCLHEQGELEVLIVGGSRGRPAAGRVRRASGGSSPRS